MPPDQERQDGADVARRHRVAIFVVAYNAEDHIRETLRRIPEDLLPLLECIYVFDDKSPDRTAEVARRLEREIPKLEVHTTPYNQGYGGNQKLGYRYAIERGFDIVVLLHGDGQYAPEALPRLLAPFREEDCSAVFGSRMMIPGAARRGGMPLYKRVGNRILTFLENRLLGTDLSEFHSGYRAYRVRALRDIPFRHNTDDFHFDTEIIVQLVLRGHRIVEVPIPTYYGDEICHVNGMAYAFRCIATILRALSNRIYLAYHPRYDFEVGDPHYEMKRAPTSLHQYVLSRGLKEGSKVLDLGAGEGEIGAILREKGMDVLSVDRKRPGRSLPQPFAEHELDEPFAEKVMERMGGQADLVLALDVLEHLVRPEDSLEEIRKALAPEGELLASTGNIAFAPFRVGLIFGQFNYGKKGILDLTHKRLFTVRSFRRLLEGGGFRVDRVRGFGPPIEDMVGQGSFLKALDRLAAFLARLWPSVFGYQFLMEATRLHDLEDILTRMDIETRDEPPAAGPGPTPRRGSPRE
jgi:glycosyltransferase involved in cell wall biosynthesis